MGTEPGSGALTHARKCSAYLPAAWWGYFTPISLWARMGSGGTMPCGMTCSHFWHEASWGAREVGIPRIQKKCPIGELGQISISQRPVDCQNDKTAGQREMQRHRNSTRVLHSRIVGKFLFKNKCFHWSVSDTLFIIRILILTSKNMAKDDCRDTLGSGG